jgi:hypothetical protein
MAVENNRELCVALLKAESEAEVVALMEEYGYWDKPELWRFYGDVENNWGQSGNQQSLAEAALAEKIVNSVDARLIDECKKRGINAASREAPQSIRTAVAQFFEHSAGEKIATGGLIEDWSTQKTRQVADQITLTATGTRPAQLNLTIADCGEGQTPGRLPDTILSLSKSNKVYIPFVQGQFNQGGTGALRFCGNHNLQLVISKRNPAHLGPDASEHDHEWCFTIVRRERPSGGRKNSVYTYLAPVGVGSDRDERHGSVLSFKADQFPIFPNDDGPYEREVGYGTAIKLYDYRYLGEKSNILRGKSLLSRLDLLLPEIALPVRFYEYRRDKKGTLLPIGSRRTTMSGLRRRLKDSPNVESGFPVAVPLQPDGERLIARIFAFRPEGSTIDDGGEGERGNTASKKLGGLRGYRKREGVLFVRNGQTQGSLPKDFFRRDAVKMKPLADDILIIVECDELSDVVREDLFMPSRDRLADNDFKAVLIDALEKAIRDCQELKDLRNQRQQERMSERLEDEQPLADVLQSLIKSSPNLTTLLALGQRIKAPFKTQPTGSDQREDFNGEVYPSYFKIKGVEYGEPLKCSRPINQRVRLTFETDARNDYFTRPADRGAFTLTWLDDKGNEVSASPTGPTLRNGLANVMFDLPDSVEVGNVIEFIARTKDTRGEFENRIILTVQPEAEKKRGGRGKRKPPTQQEGHERERPMEVAPPVITRVGRDEWEAYGFDEFTALKVEAVGYSDDESTDLYEFRVNVDNTPLEHEAKQKRLSSDQYKLLREQFLYANVLVGLSLLLESKRRKDEQDNGVDNGKETVEEQVERTTRALAPFMPTLISLGSGNLDADDQVEGLEETA